MRPLIAALILGGFAAQAEAVLTLPPTPEWVEEKDPLPPPTREATTRFFRRKPDMQVTLRVTREPKMQLTYTAEVVAELQKQFAAYEEKRSQGQSKIRLSRPRIFVVEGVNVGSFQVENGPALHTIFYVPSDDGDLILGSYTALARPSDLQEVIDVVQGAKNLRKPPTPPYRLFGALAGLAIAAAAIVAFRRFSAKKSSTPAT